MQVEMGLRRVAFVGGRRVECDPAREGLKEAGVDSEVNACFLFLFFRVNC
jgi:hypothetical protein